MTETAIGVEDRPVAAAVSTRRLRLPRARWVYETAGFVGSRVLLQLVGAVAAALLAREMSTAAFGSYSFASSFLLFLAMFFEFGIFFGGAREAAVRDEAARRRLLAAGLVAFVPVAVLFVLTVEALSFGVDTWFNVNAGGALRVVAPLLIVVPFDYVALQYAQGLDRLHTYSVTSACSRFLFVASVTLGVVAGFRMSLVNVLVVEAVTGLCGWVAFTVWMRPAWDRVRDHLRMLVSAARSYGFNVYCGRVLSMGTYNMDVLMVAAFAGAKAVSYYALAGSMAEVVFLPATGMAAALFARLAAAPRLDRRWCIGAGVVCACTGTIVVVAAPTFVRIVFSSRYLPAVGLVFPLVLAGVVRGITAMYNAFLAAHSLGGSLRNASLVLTGSNLVLNLALIPPFGARGAAWASFFALLANLTAHIVSYRRSMATEVAGTAAPT